METTVPNRIAERKQRDREARRAQIISAARRIAELEGWSHVTVRRLNRAEYGNTIYPTNMLDNASGIAVSPDGNLVSVAARGYSDQWRPASGWIGGGLVLLAADTGVLVTNINYGSGGSYFDTAWDQAGNLYGTQYGMWRVFSPPGTNQSTTTSPLGVQIVNAITSPRLAAPQWSGSQLVFRLEGQPSVTYLIDASSDLATWATVATNYSASATRTVCVDPSIDNSVDPPAVLPATFYRARVAPDSPAPLSLAHVRASQRRSSDR